MKTTRFYGGQNKAWQSENAANRPHVPDFASSWNIEKIETELGGNSPKAPGFLGQTMIH